ncbi:MAG: adenosylcobinamide amidohydrolase, partial [Desulfobacteraceae bacterium]|nr:adenosylcobinamide amidohydrolase [Desulfobacteraceae bacterium]
MKIKKLLGFYTCIIIFIGLFINCAASLASYPVKVKDSKGNYLKFSQPPQRLVSLVPSATQILFEIGAKKFVAAITYHDITLAGA